MIRFMCVVIFSFAFSISSAQSRYTTRDSLNSFCDKVMQLVTDGKYSEAMQMFRQKSVMADAVVNDIDKTLNEQMPNIIPVYGKIMGYELIEEKAYKNALAQRRYILKFEFYFLTFDFILYNNNTGWSVSNFYYKDKAQELF